MALATRSGDAISGRLALMPASERSYALRYREVAGAGGGGRRSLDLRGGFLLGKSCGRPFDGRARLWPLRSPEQRRVDIRGHVGNVKRRGILRSFFASVPAKQIDLHRNANASRFSIKSLLPVFEISNVVECQF